MNGKIYVCKNSDSPAIMIQSENDLSKLLLIFAVFFFNVIFLEIGSFFHKPAQNYPLGNSDKHVCHTLIESTI